MAQAEYTGEPQGSNGEAVSKVISTLMEIMSKENLVDHLEKTKLSEIATQAIQEYDIDKGSRSDWEVVIKDATELAMLTADQKNTPFEKAANVKYPLLTTAALQFNARAYPAIVQNDKVVKCRVNGRDPQGSKAERADRVSEYTSHQLIEQQPNWEDDTDQLLVILPIVGSIFRKVYFDPALGRNCTKLVPAEKLVVNYWARSLDTVPRTTEEMDLYPHEIQERIRDGRFIEFEYATSTGNEDSTKEATSNDDPDAPHLFLEQHRLIDLDGDGYPEPYIVTVHKATEQICRIVANFSEDTIKVDREGKISSIRKIDYYIKYTFMPSPDGGFYGWGFGWLLKGINESINTTLNQMMDAGTLANMQGGLVSSVLGLKEKKFKLGLGEWKVVNTTGPMNQAIMPISYPGPSPVLFTLLGMLVEAGKEVASIKDVLTGEAKSNMTATATVALIEQGLQVFTAIFKRIHRALRKELVLHGKLNEKHLSIQQYSEFFDEVQAGQEGGQPQPVQFNPAEDFASKDMNISPVSDPNSVTKMQQITKAQMVFEMSKENPAINPIEATKRFLEAAQVEDVEGLMVEPPKPDPVQQEIEQIVLMLGLEKEQAEILAIKAKAIKDIADAEAKEEGTQISGYKAILEAMKVQQDGQGRLPSMENQSSNSMGNQGVN